MKKSAVVIGAGPCGLVATKELLEAGHDVVCLEQSHVIGGVFSTLRESSYDDLFLTVSNVFMAYSDLVVGSCQASKSVISTHCI